MKLRTAIALISSTFFALGCSDDPDATAPLAASSGGNAAVGGSGELEVPIGAGGETAGQTTTGGISATAGSGGGWAATGGELASGSSSPGTGGIDTGGAPTQTGGNPPPWSCGDAAWSPNENAKTVADALPPGKHAGFIHEDEWNEPGFEAVALSGDWSAMGPEGQGKLRKVNKMEGSYDWSHLDEWLSHLDQPKYDGFEFLTLHVFIFPNSTPPWWQDKSWNAFSMRKWLRTSSREWVTAAHERGFASVALMNELFDYYGKLSSKKGLVTTMERVLPDYEWAETILDEANKTKAELGSDVLLVIEETNVMNAGKKHDAFIDFLSTLVERQSKPRDPSNPLDTRFDVVHFQAHINPEQDGVEWNDSVADIVAKWRPQARAVGALADVRFSEIDATTTRRNNQIADGKTTYQFGEHASRAGLTQKELALRQRDRSVEALFRLVAEEDYVMGATFWDVGGHTWLDGNDPYDYPYNPPPLAQPYDFSYEKDVRFYDAMVRGLSSPQGVPHRSCE